MLCTCFVSTVFIHAVSNIVGLNDLMVGLNDLKGLFQAKWFYASNYLWQSSMSVGVNYKARTWRGKANLAQKHFALTSSTGLWTFCKTLVFPVIELIKLLQAAIQQLSFLRSIFGCLPAAGTTVTGSLRHRFGTFTFIDGQVSHRLRERQEHLTFHKPHLAAHSTGDTTGGPSLRNKPVRGRKQGKLCPQTGKKKQYSAVQAKFCLMRNKCFTSL